MASDLDLGYRAQQLYAFFKFSEKVEDVLAIFDECFSLSK
jgi:hypothetical protein